MGRQGPGSPLHHQVPTQEGPLPRLLHRSHQHEGRRNPPKHHLGHQLLRLSPQEELAKPQVRLPQVHHGQARPPTREASKTTPTNTSFYILKQHNNNNNKLLDSWMSEIEVAKTLLCFF